MALAPTPQRQNRGEVTLVLASIDVGPAGGGGTAPGRSRRLAWPGPSLEGSKLYRVRSLD